VLIYLFELAFLLASLPINSAIVHHYHHSDSPRLYVLPPREPSLGAKAGEALGKGLASLVQGVMEAKVREQETNKLINMFESLGYDRAQSKIYAKMALDNPNGFAGVVAHIEHQNIINSEFKKQEKLMQLKHKQDKEMLAYQKQLFNNDSKRKDLRDLIIFILLSSVVALFACLVIGFIMFHRRYLKK
jgi:hypothetical protein